jgi:6-pyruvoyltetrahydropterin/6-carboxytetrahydropterin synthase
MTNHLSCVRRLHFCAGHRVAGHENKCRNLHGHNYVVYIHAETLLGLDSVGRVVDFSVLKETIGGWIDTNWDHGFILWMDDMQARLCVEALAGQKVYQLPSNPTAENLAAYLLDHVCDELFGSYFKLKGFRIYKVVVEETENCSAEVSVSRIS